MSILSDRWIRDKALNHGMIEPFVEAQRREGCISYGLSSYGYDARVADEFKVFTNVHSAVVGSQPFGGEGLSGTGPKAGGPHYLPRFATERVTTIDTTAAGGNASLLAGG